MSNAIKNIVTFPRSQQWKLPAKMTKSLVPFILIGALLVAATPGFGRQPASDTLDAIRNSVIPPRDPVDLAVRLGGKNAADASIASRPVYQVGDVVPFYIGGYEEIDGGNREFMLAGAGDNIYMWVERGMEFDRAFVDDVVTTASTQIFPRVRSIFGSEYDVDNDPHIYVLNLIKFVPGVAGAYFGSDIYPDELIPHSNEINSVVMARSLTNNKAGYLNTLAHEFQHMVQANQDDSEATWITEGMAEVGSFLAMPDIFSRNFQVMYLETATGNQLNYWPYESSTFTYYGGSSLFLIYLVQRYGEDIARQLSHEPADDIVGIDRILTQNYDTTFNDVFADFVMANLVNDASVGDGRYAHSLLDIREHAPPFFSFNSYPVDLSGSSVKQYGTSYYEFTGAAGQPLNVSFSGQPEAVILPMRANSGDHFYWSQASNQGNARLTGSFDLRNTDSATLNFWSWYEIEEFWDYGYLSVSTDDGLTWTVIETDNMSAENPYDRSFAPGITGTSNIGESSPAPYIGVAFTTDELTVTDLSPGAPAATAGVQVGDTLIAINGERVLPPTFTDIIDQYTPGESATLTFLRNGVEISITVQFGENPYRNTSRPHSWLETVVDLSPFAGNEILIRFDYVTDQAVTLGGWAIDDISIPEIDFFDDAEQPDPAWNQEGWVRITNDLPQGYLVQLVEYDSTINVTRLLQPDQGQSGSWNFTIPANGRVVLAVSGTALVTTQPARFDLVIQPAQ